VNYEAPLWINFPPVKPFMRWVMVWVIGMWKWRVLRCVVMKVDGREVWLLGEVSIINKLLGGS
jgi:hypothetical protein